MKLFGGSSSVLKTAISNDIKTHRSIEFCTFSFPVTITNIPPCSLHGWASWVSTMCWTFWNGRDWYLALACLRPCFAIRCVRSTFRLFSRYPALESSRRSAWSEVSAINHVSSLALPHVLYVGADIHKGQRVGFDHCRRFRSRIG